MNQWDKDVFEQIGYEFQSSYYKGETSNASIISWTGIYGNLTVNETLAFLFDPKTENINTNSMRLPPEMRTILPFGQCKTIQETPKKILKSNPDSRRHVHGNVSFNYIIFCKFQLLKYCVSKQ